LVYNKQPLQVALPNITAPILDLTYSLDLEVQIFDPQRLMFQTAINKPEELTRALVEEKLRPTLEEYLAFLCKKPEFQAFRNNGQNLAEHMQSSTVLEEWGLKATKRKVVSRLSLPDTYTECCRMAYTLLQTDFTDNYSLLEQILYGDTKRLVEKVLAKTWSEPDTTGGFSNYQKFKALHKAGVATDLLFEYVRTNLPDADLVFLQGTKTIW
jgi:hypothetical protein